MQEKGTISVNTENIFPIIKKFLYSDHEIFLRELVSNAIDASQKLKKLASMGEFNGEIGDLKVTVSLDEAAKTITITDNGIGMTTEEVKKYINQVAFSGAAEFVEKYKDKGDNKEIIGHFGLGFYSAFMVSEKVRIITKSFQEGAEGVQWTCDGSTSFEIEPTVKNERGTEITLYVSEDSQEFLDKNRLEGILKKYCKFLPVTIEFDGQTINNPNPIWIKNPTELKDEDYLDFYKELYPYSEDPLFWIHLNVDYPFNLTGILYFPKIKSNIDIQKEKIQLYSRQVFITDEVKDVVPEFLMLLHGIIDSPDIPLNVSRSFLQADGNVKKINGYITRKVADKLNDLFNADRTAFEQKWDSVGLFIKYGILTDEKFFEKAKSFCLLKNTEGKFFTFDEYTNFAKVNQTDKNGNTIFIYATEEGKQNTYIQSAKKKGYDVLIFDNPMIDNHFIQALESKLEKVMMKRVDSDTADKLIESENKVESVLSEEETNRVKEIFEGELQNKNLTFKVESMPVDELPVVITVPEFMRRMQDMYKGNAMFGEMPLGLNVSINGNHQITQKILKSEDIEQQKRLVRQVYDLALLSQNMLSGAELTNFIERSIALAV